MTAAAPADINLYSGPIDVSILINSEFVKNDPSIQVIFIGNQRHTAVLPSARFVFVYSEHHICVLVRNNTASAGKPTTYELFDSYPSADTGISHFIGKSFQISTNAPPPEQAVVVQRDRYSCLPYALVYVHFRQSADTTTHEEAVHRLAAMKLGAVRELAFRILKIIE